MIRRTCTLIPLLLLCSCLEPNIDWGARERINQEDAKLFEVIYEGAPTVPLVTNLDYQEKLEQIQKSEYYQNLLTNYFGKRHDLWGYGAADFDSDGTRNWTMDFYTRKLKPLDMDIDGDGFLNIEDEDPYDPKKTAQDSDGDGIADHLDWSISMEDEALISIQNRIYENSGILVFNKDDRFSLQMLEVIEIVLTEVFPKQKALVKYISASAGKNEHGGNSGANAFYSEKQQEITINLGNRKRNVFDMVKVVAHELGHALHFGNREIIDNLISKMPWNEKLFRGKKSFYHRQQMQSNYHEMIRSGNDEGLDSKEIIMPLTYSSYAKDNKIMSSYSVENSTEYFAECVTAYAFLKAVANGYFSERDIRDHINFNPYNIPEIGLKFLETNL